MSTGAYRDASAAIERAEMLERENEELRTELAILRRRIDDNEDVAKLRKENEELRAFAEGPLNAQAVHRRLVEERDELTRELAELRTEHARVATELRQHKLRFEAQANEVTARTEDLARGVQYVLERLFGSRRKSHSSIGPMSSPESTKKASP